MSVEHSKSPVAPLEHDIYDLRHQLITASLYQLPPDNYSVRDFAQLPPIIVTPPLLENGQRITLFHDNTWGITNRKVFQPQTEDVPEDVLKVWASIYLPDFQAIIKELYSGLKDLRSQLDQGEFRYYHYNEKRTNLWKRSNFEQRQFVLQNEVALLQGIKGDLEFVVQEVVGR